MLNPQDKQFYEANGYFIARQLFSLKETASYKDHYMHLREAAVYPGDDVGVQATSSDPLKRYPRMIHMHRWDETSLNFMLDARINQHITGFSGREPYAVQTMMYFKPPKARGQALHQDQYFLRVNPGTCIAAWLALDACDEENGCLQVVPGSHTWPILCVVPADTSKSFTDITVPIPEGQEVRSMIMQPGDVLFFNGSLVHGSGPNITQDRFRRSLIGHYIEGEAREVYHWYHPILRMDGTAVTMAESDGGSACGVWTDQQNQPVIELNGTQKHPGTHE